MSRVYKQLISSLISLAACTLVACCSCGESDPADFNFGWNFRLGEMDSNYQLNNAGQSADGWQQVRIPHDWSIECGYTQENTAGSNGFLPGGVGWYQKRFSLPKSYNDKDIFVRFEAVYNNAQVWINGHDLGNFPNGYLDFEYELTPYIKRGAENIITVRVDRRAYADARWYVGGGIYRPVHLIARNKISMPTHAQRITTPKVSKQMSQVNILTDIENKGGESQMVTIDYEILLEGKSIATVSQQQRIGAASTATASQSIDINSPTLWSLESPKRYELKTTILCGDKIYDQRSEFFGVRTAIFDPNLGLLLNGQEVKIKGVNIHHDLGCLGVKLFDKALYRRLKKMQDMGVNAIRTAHNPHSESLLEMCDTMGLLVMNEFIDEWRKAKNKWIVQRSQSGIADSLQMGYPAHFDKWAERDLKAFIRRDYNHPSVILWSIGNEIEWSYPYYFASVAKKTGYKGLVFDETYAANLKEIKARFDKLSGGDDELARTAQQLSKWVKDVDTTRPVTSGIAIPTVSLISGYIDALDVIGYNYKHTIYENDHKIHPDRSIIGSENVGQYYEWKAVMDKPYIPGIFIWTGVDYIGENGPFPAKGGTYSLFDFALFKTARGEFFETLWSDKPKTHIVTTPASLSEFKLQKDGSFTLEYRDDKLRKWQWFDTFDKWSYVNKEPIVVQVYTNAPKAELKINGRSLGVKSRSDFPEENILLWQIPYRDGVLTAIGLDKDNKPVSQHSLSTAGELSQIYAECDSYEVKSDGYDLAHIDLSLQDIRGTLICDSDREITITTDENSLILGVDNGSDKFIGSHLSNKIVTHNGRALVIIQPKVGAEGSSRVVFTTEGGMKRTVTLNYTK